MYVEALPGEWHTASRCGSLRHVSERCSFFALPSVIRAVCRPPHDIARKHESLHARRCPTSTFHKLFLIAHRKETTVSVHREGRTSGSAPILFLFLLTRQRPCRDAWFMSFSPTRRESEESFRSSYACCAALRTLSLPTHLNHISLCLRLFVLLWPAPVMNERSLPGGFILFLYPCVCVCVFTFPCVWTHVWICLCGSVAAECRFWKCTLLCKNLGTFSTLGPEEHHPSRWFIWRAVAKRSQLCCVQCPELLEC